MSDSPHLSRVYKEYEDGKHRRYELLFKVNGAAFAVVAFAADADTAAFAKDILSIRALAIGMLAFTIAMGIDIFAFGWGMKQIFPRQGKIRYSLLPLNSPMTPLGAGVFRKIGMTVLVVIVLLIAVGWGLVACNASPK